MNNNLIQSAGGSSLVITDSSGNTAKNTIYNNSSETTYMPNFVGAATTFRSGATIANGATITGGASISSATITGAATVGSTFGVTGLSTLSGKVILNGDHTTNLVQPNEAVFSLNANGIAAGFEQVLRLGTTTALKDRILIYNATSNDNVFSPVFRVDSLSTAFPSNIESFFFQAWIRQATTDGGTNNNTGTTAVMVFQTRTDETPFTIVNTRPLFAFRNFGTDIVRYYSDRVWINNTINLEFSTSTGSKIGTLATEKIGFWGATPAVQQAAVANATDAPSVIARLNDLLARLRTIGIIAT
jgi:hypothetical protein